MSIRKENIDPPGSDYHFDVKGIYWDDSIQVVNGREWQGMNKIMICLECNEIMKDGEINKDQVKKHITLMLDCEVLDEYSMIFMRMYRTYESRLKELDGDK